MPMSYRLKVIGFFLWLGLMPINLNAANAWEYIQENDRLTNRAYSFAKSPLPRRDLYDNLHLEVVCRDNALQVIVDADSLIASQGSKFDVEYQIDQKSPVKIQMTTFKDSKRRGYTSEFAAALVSDMLSGKAVFVRVHTLIREVLSGSIPMDGGAEPLTRVLADCGINSSGNTSIDAQYGLEDFEKDYAKLSVEQQRQVLDKIKRIIKEFN